METVWGKLSTLNTSDTELMDKILRFDKHAVPEGFIAENLVEQILERFSDGKTIYQLKVHTSIAVKPEVWKYHAFVWTDETPDNTIPYLDVLTKKYTVYVVRYDKEQKEFFSTETPYKSGASSRNKLTYKPLQEVLQKITDTTPVFSKVSLSDSSVRNVTRHNQAIWGFLSVLFSKDIFTAAVLPRIFMNFGANLYFGKAWDVDRTYMIDGKVVVLEVKHKDPFPHSKPKYFGINKGSLNVLENLCKGGARCYHLILVKPVWDKEVSSMYLLGNLKARENALLVGCEITLDKIAMIKKGGTKESGEDTSFSGKEKLKYYSLPITEFHVIGSLSVSVAENAAKIRDALAGVTLPRLTIQDLVSRRIRL